MESQSLNSPDYILVCEQSRSVAARLKEITGECENLKIVNGRTMTEALEMLAQYQPHLIILGTGIQDESNQSLLRSLKESPLSQNVPIMALPQSEDFVEGNSIEINQYVELLEAPESLLKKINGLIESSRYFFQESESNILLGDFEILVAEDSISYMNVYKNMLNKMGLKSKRFENGKLAWDYLVSCESLPDLIISDIVMPEMTGMELVRRIRLERKFDNIPIVVSSTISQNNQLNAIFGLGANDFFPKPIEPNIFTLKIRSHLKTHSLIKTQLTLQADLKATNKELDNLIAEQRKVNDDLNQAMNELGEMQGKLIESEKLASLGGVVTGIAHEINTPLGVGITGVSHMKNNLKNLLIKKESDGLTKKLFWEFCEDLSENINLVEKNLSRGAKIVSSFKSISPAQSGGEKSLFSLYQCIKEGILTLDSESRRIEIDCNEKLMITSFPDALRIIVSNLVSNSIIHAYQEGKEGVISVKVQVSGDAIKMIFSDDGEGMDEEMLRHLFVPFFTTKRGEGFIGLGGSIVYNLAVQRLDGTIVCHSKLGDGTKIELDFLSCLDC